MTSDNVSPLHLMDIKRVAFETRPVASKRPAATTQPAARSRTPIATSAPATVQSSAAPKVSRQEIAAIVDRFLANRQPEPAPLASPPPPKTDQSTSAAGNDGANRSQAGRPPATPASSNGHAAAEFVSEDDVKRAIQKGEKIYVGPKTIITPSARDIGNPAEVFAKA